MTMKHLTATNSKSIYQGRSTLKNTSANWSIFITIFMKNELINVTLRSKKLHGHAQEENFELAKSEFHLPDQSQ